MNSSKFEKVSAIRGMNDALPDDARVWQWLEHQLTHWLQSYGYQPIRTPILEHTRLYTRGIGEVTDIVEKEMYTFTDALNQESLTLRPEFTAGIARACIEHSLTYDGPRRLFSLGPVFRHERPQRGRYRQFHQLDVEALGFNGPDIDAEQIVMLSRLWRKLGLEGVRLEINTLGAAQERAAHRAALVDYLTLHEQALDDDSRRRLHTNPLRILDSKNPEMQALADGAPQLLNYLGAQSREHFDGLCAYLSASGIEFHINPRMVRGLDYYNSTVFEWISGHLGAQATVCGGGRYDGLMSLLGGKPTPAVGFAIGLERLLMLCRERCDAEASWCDAYLMHTGPIGRFQAFATAEQLRNEGWRVILQAGESSLKSQMKRANASGARFAVIFPEGNIDTATITVKPMREPEQARMSEGAQIQVSLAGLPALLAELCQMHRPVV